MAGAGAAALSPRVVAAHVSAVEEQDGKYTWDA